ncbi:hypothetical protein Droror1_Dr00014792 [Drosera rotundifolia]
MAVMGLVGDKSDDSTAKSRMIGEVKIMRMFWWMHRVAFETRNIEIRRQAGVATQRATFTCTLSVELTSTGIFKGKSLTGITTIIIFFEPVREVVGDEQAETRTSEPSVS